MFFLPTAAKRNVNLEGVRSKLELKWLLGAVAFVIFWYLFEDINPWFSSNLNPELLLYAAACITVWKYINDDIRSWFSKQTGQEESQDDSNVRVGGHIRTLSQSPPPADPVSKRKPHLSHLRPPKEDDTTNSAVCASCGSQSEVLNETPVRMERSVQTHTMYKCSECGDRWSDEK